MMKKKPVKLTDAYVESLPAGKHGLRHGLSLSVSSADGVRSFYFRYRVMTQDGSWQARSVHLGHYPQLSLADAQAKAAQCRALLHKGEDPRKTMRPAKKVLAGRTFEDVFSQWLGRMSRRWSEVHAASVKECFERDVLPRIGALPMAELSSGHVLGVVEAQADRGAVDTAYRTLGHIERVYEYWVPLAGEGAGVNSCRGLKQHLPPMPAPRNRKAVLDPGRLGEMIRIFPSYKGSSITRAALMLAPLLVARPGEVRHMEWSEIDWVAKTWTIPARKLKLSKDEKANGVPHIVPLARQAVQILRELRELRHPSKFVFPSSLGGGKVISENTVRSALIRLEFEDQSWHGFRAVFRTLGRGVLKMDPIALECQLSHKGNDPLKGACDRDKYLEERGEIMQKWADYLYSLAEEEEGRSKPAPLMEKVCAENVIQFPVGHARVANGGGK